MVKNLPANAGYAREEVSINPWVGEISGIGNGMLLLFSSLENFMGRGVWWAPVHPVAKTWIPTHILFFTFFSFVGHYKILNILSYALY